MFVSPAQRDAAASPPPPGILTAPVGRGDLVDAVSVSATVTRGTTIEVPLAAGSDGLAVVTATPADSTSSLTAGKVVLEVSGRPVLLVTGRFPFYRSLRRGDTGPDVAQLQTALTRAGFPVAADGRFGARTAASIREFYRAAGYPAPTEAGEEGAMSLIVPPGEFAVVPRLPVRIDSAPALGEVLTGDSALRLASGPVVVRASIPAAVQVRLIPGMSAVVQGADGEHAATIASIGEPDPESGEAELLLAGPEGDPLPEEWLGTDVVAMITVELLEQDALLVPSIAVIPAADGPPSVEVVRGDRRVRVAVRELAALDGISAVAPVDGVLAEGDLVRIG
ncbi:MAG TPA: peptidoglycan-binding domain-containing protein [Pseudolysinimonas sp.]|nr:peptidoglycan-binding domain-containing protein [Pseudolysinimonas sp.]